MLLGNTIKAKDYYVCHICAAKSYSHVVIQYIYIIVQRKGKKKIKSY